MGRVAPVLSGARGRLGAFLLVLVPLVAYYVVRADLPNVDNNWDVFLIAAVLLPAVFALVYLALPLTRARGLLPVGLAFFVLALVLDQVDLALAANFSKLAAMTLLGFAFLDLFESVTWVVLVAAIIPAVDAYSVWRGPTHDIVEKKPELFTTLSFSFPVPGQSSSANLGLPDLLFFALFLGAAARFGLRVRLTWLALVLSFSATMLLTVWGDFPGLPALPLLSLAFLAANADLLWRAVRRRRRDATTGPSGSRSQRERAQAG